MANKIQHPHFPGIWFDSMAEAHRYRELLLMEKADQISDLAYHTVTVELTTAPITYKPDFIYEEKGRIVYEDVKGTNPRYSTRFPTIKKLWRDYGPAGSILREVRFNVLQGQYRFRTHREIPCRKEADCDK